jgi:hypothetical protein
MANYLELNRRTRFTARWIPPRKDSRGICLPPPRFLVKESKLKKEGNIPKLRAFKNYINSLENAEPSLKLLLCGLKVSPQTNLLAALFGKNHGSVHA